MSDIIKNRYKILETAGTGGFGAVYKVQDTVEDEIRALKYARPGAQVDFLADQSFRQEFKVMTTLSHPNLLKVFDYDTDSEGKTFFTMEFIEGFPLDDLKWHPRSSLLYRIINEILFGLDALHSREMIHSDVKPSNIMIETDDPVLFKQYAATPEPVTELPEFQVKLLDFGLLKQFESGDEGGGAGTLEYAAPEILLGKPVDHRSDLYSLGMTFYEMLTGELPFQAAETFQIVQKQIEEIPPPPSTKNPDIPPLLDDLIVKLLEKEPRRRYQFSSDIREILFDIQEIPVEERAREDFTKHLFDSSFIGREAAITAARTFAVEAGRRREVRFLHLAGGRGSGKSALADKLKTGFQLKNVCAAVSTCADSGTGVPYKPIERLIRFLLAARETQITDLSVKYPGELGRIFPEFEVSGQQGSGDGEQREWAEYRFFEAILDVFRELTSKRSVLIFDDLHLADEPTLKLLGYIMRGIRSRPILFVLFYRSDWDSSILKELTGLVGDEENTAEMTINPFTKEESDKMAGSILGTYESTPAFLDALHKYTEGVPGLIDLRIRQLIEAGKLFRSAGKWTCEVSSLADDLESIADQGDPDDFLRERVSSLPEGVRDALCLCAAAEMCDQDLMTEVLGISEAEASRILNEMLSAGFVRDVVESERSCITVSSRHLASMILTLEEPGKINTLKGKIARILEKRRLAGEPVPEILLAELFIGGRMPGKAVKYSRKAGERLEAAYDPGKAIRIYSRVLELIENEPRFSKDRFELAFRLGSLHLRAGDQQEALARFGEALEAAADPHQEAMVHRNLAELNHQLNNIDEIEGCFRKALESANRIKAKSRQAEAIASIHLLRGVVLADGGNVLEALDAVEMGIDAVKSRESLWELRVKLYNSKSRFLIQTGKAKEASALIKRTIRMAERRNAFRSLSASINMLGILSYGRGDFVSFLKEMASSLMYAEKAGDAVFIERLYSNIGLINHQLGNWDNAYNHCRKGLLLAEKISDTPGVVSLLDNLAVLSRDKGNLDASLRYYDRAIRLAESQNLERALISLTGNLGELHIVADRLDEAEAMVQTSLAASREQGVVGEELENLRRLAEIAIKRDNVDKAISVAGKAMGLAESQKNKQEQAKLKRLLALAFRSKGKPEVIIENLEASRTMFLEQGLDFERARTAMELGRYYYEFGQRGKAKKHFVEAEEIFNQLGALHYLTKVKELLQSFKSRKRDMTGHMKRMQMLLESSRALAAVLDTDKLFTLIIDMSLEITSAERGFLLQPSDDTLRFLVARNKDRSDIPGQDFAISNSVVENVIKSRRPLTIRDIKLSTRFKSRESIKSLELKSIICVPLFAGDDLLGIIYVDNNLATAESFTDDDEQLLEALSGHAVVALQNAKLHGDLRHSYDELVNSKTELETTYRDLKETQDSLIHAEKMVAFGQLAAGIAHELKQPLTAIQLYSEMTLRRAKEESTTKYLADIHKEATRMSELVGRINRYTRKSSAVEFKRLNIVEPIEYALKLTKKKFTLPYIKVNRRFPETPLYIDGDSAQLEQVFSNLFTNACDAMVEGRQGEIWIDLVEASTEETVTVSIRDNGSGIPQEIQDKFFAPFFTTKEPGKGTGLGLSIVLGIVNNHSGVIEAQSDSNEGTTFYLRFPRKFPD